MENIFVQQDLQLTEIPGGPGGPRGPDGPLMPLKFKINDVNQHAVNRCVK